MGRVRGTVMWLLAGAVFAGAGGGCQDCEMPGNVSTRYSCQVLPSDSPAAGCAGGPVPEQGGVAPDADSRFPVGCKATQSVCGTASPSTSTGTRTCTCEQSSQLVDAGRTSGIWVCQ